MSVFRLAPRLASKTLAASSSKSGTYAVSELLRRSFRSTACRKEQFFDADQATFDKAISKENSQGKVVLVDFYADWCGPCKMLSPILTKLTAPENAVKEKTGSGRSLDLVTVDTDQQPELALRYEVSALPTVFAFKDGESVQRFVGALPEKGVRDFIASL